MVEDQDLSVTFEKGETIHIYQKSCENSVARMFSGAGLDVEQLFFDSHGWFSLAKLSRADL